MTNNTVNIPIVARMVPNDCGGYSIDRERSVYVDMPADTVARFIMEGLHMQFEPRADAEVTAN